jgi:hypothetical protein
MEILGWILQGFGTMTSIGAFVVGLYLLSAKSYFQKKGENLATKEVIAFITKEVETVKNDLLYKSQIRTTMYRDKRQAVIKTYEAFSLWYHKADHTLMNSIGFELDQPIKAIKENEEAYYQAIIAEAKMELYINDDELLQASMNVKSKIHDFLKPVELYFVALNGCIRVLDNALPDGGESDPIKRQAILKNAEKLSEQKGQLYSQTVSSAHTVKMEINDLMRTYRAICFKIISEEYSKEKQNV